MRRPRCLLLLLLLVVPAWLSAQVLPPPVGGPVAGAGAVPETLCVNSVGVGLTSQGVLLCGPVTPVMTTGLAPTGDVSPTWQVLATHLAVPLPPLQGGTGLAGGPPGGLLYFSGPATLAATPVFPQNAPLLGGGVGAGPVAGTRSGTTLALVTALGPTTVGKQLTFDPSGNLVATDVDVGPGAVSSVFGRTGTVIPQAGDYTAAQVTNAADAAAANVFVHPAGQTMARVVLPGDSSGLLTLRAPPVAGTSTLTFPAGVTDFSTTGGPGQVVRQSTVGGALLVGTLGFADLTGVASVAQVPQLQSLQGLVPTTKGGLGWTDTQTSGSSHVLATVQGVLTAGLGVTADAQGNLITTGLPPGGGGGSGTITSGGPGTLAFYPVPGTTLADSGVAVETIPTAAAAFTAGQVLQAAGNNRTVSASGILVSALCTTTGICAGYQAALGFAPENLANKTTNSVLGTNPNVYPSEGAVKGYVDTALTTKQDAVIWGAGLSAVAATVSVASAESGFLANGGATPLGCGPGTQGRMQVLASGELQYCDGATTAVLRSGVPTQSGLKWNVTPSVCTLDGNLGKLTVNTSGEIICAADIGGEPGGGEIISVFGRTGAVLAQTGDYQASQVTNAADLTAANVFTHVNGQSMPQLLLPGSVSGQLRLRAASLAGTSVITFPPGSIDFSTTGGPGQVVRQSSGGGAFTVSQLSASDLSNGVVGSGALLLATNTAIGALVNLTQNGLVRTSGGAGVLSVDTTPYLTANQAITLSGDAAGSGTTTIPVTVSRLNGGVFSGASGNLVSFGAGNTPADSGITATSLVTAASAFTVPGRVLQAAGANRAVSESGILTSALCTTTAVCSGYQASLGFVAVPATRTLTLTGTFNQVTVSLAGAQDLTANRAWTLSLPQNIDTGAFVRHGGLGLNVAPPVTAGMLAATAGGNNLTLHTLKRFTDTTPTGAFADYQSAAGASLWTVDIAGTLTVGAVPVARVTGTLPVTAGGTGSGTLPDHGVLLGKGTAPLAGVLPTGNSQCLMSAPANFATTDPSFQACPAGAGGGVAVSGTPAANQLAIWTGPTTIAGTSTLSFNVTDFDVATATRTRPNKVGTTPPGTCSDGDTFWDSDAAAGSRLLDCKTNVWTPQGGGGTGSVTISGTPSAGQLAAWTNSNTIAGVSTLNINHAAASVAVAGTVTTSTEYVTTGAGGVTRTLPAAASSTSTRRFTVLKVDSGAGALSIAPAGADTINGAATPLSTTTQWAGFELQEVSATGWVAQPIASTAAAGASFPLVGTSNANPCFAVGPNGATDPTLSVNCSVASAATGLRVVPAAAGSGVTLEATSSSAAEAFVVRSKGVAVLTLAAQGNSNVRFSINSGIQGTLSGTTSSWTPTARTSGVSTVFGFVGAADTALTAGTEAKDFVVDLSQTKQHAGSATIALQRHMHVLPGTDTCATATCTIAEDTLLALGGPVTGGTNSTLTRSSALLIETRAVTNVATGVGLVVNPPTGATTNLAAQFLGTVQIPANLATTGTRYACFDTAGNLVSQVAACSGT